MKVFCVVFLAIIAAAMAFPGRHHGMSGYLTRFISFLKKMISLFEFVIIFLE